MHHKGRTRRRLHRLAEGRADIRGGRRIVNVDRRRGRGECGVAIEKDLVPGGIADDKIEIAVPVQIPQCRANATIDRGIEIAAGGEGPVAITQVKSFDAAGIGIGGDHI